MIKVSVIVPVYNTEKYLSKCLDSLLAQTLADIEIICVNDCSTDASLQLLQEYAGKDNRIKIIDFEKNHGAAVARNTAIEKSQGEYLGFVDSDDFVDPDFYEKLYNKAKETDADIVKGADLKIRYPDGKEVIDCFNCRIRLNKYQFLGQYTTAIFKKELIVKNNIEFPAGLLVGEDPSFLIHAVFCAKKIEVMDCAQYYYMRREGSLNSDFWSVEQVADYIKYITIVAELPNKYPISEEDKNLFLNRLIEDVYATRRNKIYPNSDSSRRLSELMKKLSFSAVGKKIKLLFDAEVLRLGDQDEKVKRGIYWVAYNLLRQFAQDERFDVTLLVGSSYLIDFYTKDKVFQNLKSICPAFRLGKGGNYRIIRNLKFNIANYDCYFNPAHSNQFEHFNSFYMLHDAMPMFDNGWFPHAFTKVFYDFHHNLSPYTYYFANSNCSKTDFLKYFDNMKEDHICVVPISSAQDFKVLHDPVQLRAVFEKYETSLDLEAKYIFYMGAVDDKRKNIVGSVKYFIDFIDKNNITDLYFLLGGNGKEKLVDGLKKYLGDKYEKYAKYIVPLGYVDVEDVNILYSHSLFFIFLSLYEGFGMPPLEAMMAGTPVICANNSSLPEVVGDAALLVDEQNEEEVLEAFKTFYYDKQMRDLYVKKGLERAKMFSWDKTCEIISDKIVECLKGKK